MTFGPLPAALVAAIQQGYLERGFKKPLYNNLAYRKIADQESFEGRIGSSITKTRHGLIIPNTTPLNPSTNTGLDNGLTPQQYTIEQYTLSIAQYPQVANPINLMDDEISIASFAMVNSENLGVAQATAVDRIARSTVFNGYMGGNTVVTVTLGVAGVAINVDDTRGFQEVNVNGVMVPVSGTNTLPVYVNGVLYQISGFTNDVSNTSSAAITGGTSGVLVATTSISIANGTIGNAVISAYAPFIARPNGRKSTSLIQSSDLLTLSVLRTAMTRLKNNSVPMVRSDAGMAYNCYLTNDSMNQLYSDTEFQTVMRGATIRDLAYENAWIYSTLLNIRFVETTEAYIQPPQLATFVPVAQTIQRPVICGQGALIEGVFRKGMEAISNMSDKGIGLMPDFTGVTNVIGQAFNYDGFYQYLRPPLDSLGQIISQTSNYVGGFTAPTDVTTTTAIIPTASNSYRKRAVVIETA